MDAEARFTGVHREILGRLEVPVESAYTAELADGSRMERIRGRMMIRLEGRESPTQVTFGEGRRGQCLLGAMAP